MTSPAASAPGRPVLSAEDVVVRFGATVALDGVALVVAEAECLALVGESGSGKTTLLRCFNRMVQPDRGAVLVRGEDVASLDAVALRRRIGYVQQEGGLLPHWTVSRNAALVPWLEGDPAARTAGEAALRRVGLEPDVFGGRWPRQLSGGQRQRVAIARALAAGPAVVLLDEPFGALDAITRADLQYEFLRLRREHGLTSLLVTHDLREAFRLADRIAVLREGRILQTDTPGRLQAAPADAYVERLLERAL